jgi:hypothetical protein
MGNMAEIVCIIGNKGGTGKTTLSHMLCQGMGLLGQRSICVLTDTYREPLDPKGRRYLIADARTHQVLGKVADKIRSLNRWVGVIDGGSNRSEMDHDLYAMASLVLLPFRDSHEDIRTVIKDLDAFPRAWAIPSQWPANAWQQEAAERTVREQLGSHADRLLQPVAALSASKLLLQKRPPDKLPTPLANACRAVAYQVLELLGIPCHEPDEEKEGVLASPFGETSAAPPAASGDLTGADAPTPTRH